MYVCVCVYVYICVCVFLCVCFVYICVCACMCVCVYVPLVQKPNYSVILPLTGDPNIVIVVTDGYSNVNSDKTSTEARALEDSGSRIIVVAVGRNINRKEINNIASDPDTENVVLLSNPDSLSLAANAVLDLLCD